MAIDRHSDALLATVTADPKLHLFGRFENAAFSYLFLSFVFF